MEIILPLCGSLVEFLMESNKDIGWYLDVDCVRDAFSFSIDMIVALSCCLFVYLNVILQLPSEPR